MKFLTRYLQNIPPGIVVKFHSKYIVVFICLLVASMGYVKAQDVTEPPTQQYALDLLKQMSDHLAASNQFSFDAEILEEEWIHPGILLQYSRYSSIAVKRPNGIWVETEDDYNHTIFHYDGSDVTLFTIPANMYATAKAPETMDATLDFIRESLYINLSLADFMYSNPYEGLMKGVNTAFYAGLHSVRKTDCHHLFFIQDDIDWQVWIESGKNKVPRKMMITYKNLPGSPSFIAHLDNWNLNDHSSEQVFIFIEPAGVVEIDFVSHD